MKSIQLAALWLKDHELFGTISLNFGGVNEYCFEERGNSLTITKEENEKYIPKFYSTPHEQLSLVSAIVGRNGAGKSTLLHTMRRAVRDLNANFGIVASYQQAVLVYEMENDRGEIEIATRSNSQQYYGFEERQYENPLEIQCSNFQESDSSPRTEAIYYSPFVDLQDFNNTFSESDDIDISVERIIQRDGEKHGNKESPTSQLVAHKHENTLRHSKFQSTSAATELNQRFKVPLYNRLKVQFRPSSFNSSQFRNTPRAFRDYYQSIYNKWTSEINATERRVNRTTNLEEDKKILKLWFLDSLLRSIFFTLEGNNDLLEEGQMSINLNDLADLDMHDALISFLENHSFEGTDKRLPVQEAKDLIEATFSVIDAAEKDNFYDEKTLTLGFEDANQILAAHTIFFNKILTFNNSAITVLDPSPPIDLSSGEKAFLDLFSRLQYAKEEIENRRNPQLRHHNNYSRIFPNHFLLLIDEGDIGFHPSWKKEYVKSLVEVAPQFFKDYEDVSVQVIFTTHDPLTLSDMINYNILYLDRSGDDFFALAGSLRPNLSFGANITNLLADSFFVEDGLVGKFAVARIDHTIKWLNEESRELNNGEAEYHKKVIQNIDEPLIQKKLSEMYAVRTGQNILQIEILQRQIRKLSKNLDNLQSPTQ